MAQIWHAAVLVVRFPRRWPANFITGSSSVEGSDIRPRKSTQSFRGAEKLEIFPRMKTANCGTRRHLAKHTVRHGPSASLGSSDLLDTRFL